MRDPYSGYELPPMTGPVTHIKFLDIRWKLWQAHMHHKALKTHTETFFKSNFYSVAPSKKDEKGRLVWRVGDVQDPPQIIGVLIGEVAYQLRSTLDHIIWQLAKPTTEREKKNVQFPLAKSSTDFRNQRHLMPGVELRVRRAVESLQPYHRRKWPETALLGYLREISNWDKHRTLVAAGADVVRSGTTVFLKGETSVISQEEAKGILKTGTIITRLQMGYSAVGAQVGVYPQVAVLPVFDERMPKPIRRRPVLSTLGKIGQFIEDTIVPMLEPLL
jgi:hypothetical protein